MKNDGHEPRVAAPAPAHLKTRRDIPPYGLRGPTFFRGDEVAALRVFRRCASISARKCWGIGGSEPSSDSDTPCRSSVRCEFQSIFSTVAASSFGRRDDAPFPITGVLARITRCRAISLSSEPSDIKANLDGWPDARSIGVLSRPWPEAGSGATSPSRTKSRAPRFVRVAEVVATEQQPNVYLGVERVFGLAGVPTSAPYRSDRAGLLHIVDASNARAGAKRRRPARQLKLVLAASP